VGVVDDDHLQRVPAAAAVFKSIRTNILGLFVISIFVNIGMCSSAT